VIETKTDAASAQSAATYRALYLVPGAPQDLVTEVYWHLVSQLLGSPDADRLKELNRAYEVIVKAFDGRPLTLAGSDKDNGRQSRKKRLRSVKKSAAAPNPSELLQVTPDAPPDVIDLAYRYWQMRMRQRIDSEARLAELDRAAATLRSRYAGPGPAPRVEAPATTPSASASTVAPEYLTSSAEPVSQEEPPAPRTGGARGGLSWMAGAFRSMARSLNGLPQQAPAEERRRFRLIMSSKSPIEVSEEEIGPDPQIEERFSDLAHHEEHEEQGRRPDVTRDSSA
jgi:hypothetical protein